MIMRMSVASLTDDGRGACAMYSASPILATRTNQHRESQR
jgi:hypothetical protein